MASPILSFSLLVHDKLQQCINLINHLIMFDVIVVVHVDLKCSDEYYNILRNIANNHKNVYFAKRVLCKWGDWSLVQAELNCIKCLIDNNLNPKYIHNLSGSDIPVKPINEFVSFLARNDSEYIEINQIDQNKWITDGLNKERFDFYFPFNYIKQKFLFQKFVAIQKVIGIKRQIPNELRPAVGSQFKTITFILAKKVLKYLESDAEVRHFFKYTWIPDESFFPTIVGSLGEDSNLAYHNLTFYNFNSYGKPSILGKRTIRNLSSSKEIIYFARKACDFTLSDINIKQD